MKIIQISDLHLHKYQTYRAFGLVNTNDTFLDVLEQVITEKPDYVIASGDLSQDGSLESYVRLNSYLAQLSCDVYTILGNHDIPANFNQALIKGNVKHCDTLKTDLVNFIFLNSYKENCDSGIVYDAELQSLELQLSQLNNCVVVIHHHFIKLNSVIDSCMLENSGELMSLLIKYQHKIKFCITGHVHNSFNQEMNGIKVHCGLSTCIQFAQTPKLLFENKKPGYTLYNFSENNYEIIEKTL